MRSRLFSLTTLANDEDAVNPKPPGLLHQAEHETNMKENTTRRWEERSPEHLARVLDQALPEAGLTLDVLLN